MNHAFLSAILLIALFEGCSFVEDPATQAAPSEKSASQAAPSATAATGSKKSKEEPLNDLRSRKWGSDWPRFLGPTGDGKSSEQGILKTWPDRGPRIVWHKKVGTSYCSPVTSKGRLYHFARFGNQARLTCMKSETGEELWKFEYPTDFRDPYNYKNGPRCSPIVDGNRVYLYGAEGMLHCVRASDGKLVWKLDTVSEFGVVPNFFGVGSTPVVEKNLLIVQVGGSPPDSPPISSGRVQGNGSGVVALDKHTGKLKYKITDELASYSSPVVTSIGKRRWCFVFARGGLVGFDPASGKVDFHYPWRAKLLESVNVSNPVVVGDRVLISETYGPGSSLLRVRDGGYEIVWKDDLNRREKSMQTHFNTPIYLDGYLYGSSGRHPNTAELRCIEWATGKIMWSKQGLARCSLMYVDGHFVCLGEDGVLRLIEASPKRYHLVAEVVLTAEKMGIVKLLKPPTWAAPIVSHGLLYVRGADRLVCLEIIKHKK